MSTVDDLLKGKKKRVSAIKRSFELPVLDRTGVAEMPWESDGALPSPPPEEVRLAEPTEIVAATPKKRVNEPAEPAIMRELIPAVVTPPASEHSPAEANRFLNHIMERVGPEVGYRYLMLRGVCGSSGRTRMRQEDLMIELAIRDPSSLRRLLARMKDGGLVIAHHPIDPKIRTIEYEIAPTIVKP